MILRGFSQAILAVTLAGGALAACSSPFFPDSGIDGSRGLDAAELGDGLSGDGRNTRDGSMGDSARSDVSNAMDARIGVDVPIGMDVQSPPDAGPCPQGFADCDRVAANGCETALGTGANCGACGDRCAPSQFCFSLGSGSFTCGDHCPAPSTQCTNACVDLTSDPLHCGTCDTVCPAPAGGTGSCANSVCGVGCAAGTHGCSGNCVSNSDPATCGSMCSPCATGPNATATCNGTQCGLACTSGYGDCNASASDGCETALNTASNCGGCGTVCSLYRGCAGTACSWQVILDALNRARATPRTCGVTLAAAAPALTYDGRIESAALAYTGDLAARNASVTQINYVASDGSTTTVRLQRAGYTPLTANYEVAGVGDGTESPDTLIAQLLAADPSICMQLMSTAYTQFGFGATAGTMYPAYIDFVLGHP